MFGFGRPFLSLYDGMQKYFSNLEFSFGITPNKLHLEQGHG